MVRGCQHETNEYNGGCSGSSQTSPLTQRGTPPSRVLLFQRLGLLEQMHHVVLFVRRAVHGTTPRQAVVRSGHAPAAQHGATSSHCTAQHVTKGCTKQKRCCLVSSTTILPIDSAQRKGVAHLTHQRPAFSHCCKHGLGTHAYKKKHPLESRRPPKPISTPTNCRDTMGPVYHGMLRNVESSSKGLLLLGGAYPGNRQGRFFNPTIPFFLCTAQNRGRVVPGPIRSQERVGRFAPIYHRDV